LCDEADRQAVRGETVPGIRYGDDKRNICLDQSAFRVP
jgi:hypothetical protein